MFVAAIAGDGASRCAASPRQALVLVAFVFAFLARARQRPDGVLPLRHAARAAGVRVRRHRGRRAGRGFSRRRAGSGRCRPADADRCVLVIGAPSLASSAWMDVLLARTDSRIVAGAVAARSAAAGAFRVRRRAGPTSASTCTARIITSGSSTRARNRSAIPTGETPHWLVITESPLRLYAQPEPALQRLAAERYTPVLVVRGTRTLDSAAVYDRRTRFSCRSRGSGKSSARGRPSPSTGAASDGGQTWV